MGNSPTNTPTLAPSNLSPTDNHSPTPVLPEPSSNSSISALHSPTPTGCACNFDLKTVAACSVFLGTRVGIFGIPRALCCRGLRGLDEADIYSCLCYIIQSNVTGKILNLSVEAALKIVSLGCRV
ncbi:hypothetical protein ACH5RR_023863 [Cinchona calisaya]|uniref:Bifunctional inhibitor/plant lipid transfer protein/seed storage helical domain-containing protein n=1 Tax=Cinchona calisaya TaxID=153742 RepID=A0ABD2ZBX0_9GENT